MIPLMNKLDQHALFILRFVAPDRSQELGRLTDLRGLLKRDL